MSIWNYISYSTKLVINYRDLYPDNQQIVLLLHGLGVDSQSWIFQEKALGEAGFRPIVPDLPGFGSSTTITREWSIENCSKILYLFVREITNKPVFLLGISLGGAIVLKMLSEHPENFEKAILINTFSKIRPEKFSSLLYLVTRLWKVIFLSIEDQAIFMAKRLFPSEVDAPYRDMIVKQIVNTDPRIYKQTLYKISLLNLDKYVNPISTPCLMITGAEDSTILPESQTALARKLQKCDQIFIEKAGHAVIVQQPDLVNRHILDFITT